MPEAITSAASRAAPVSRRRLLRWEISAVWVRFLLAMLGLALAFGAALFSTVSRESGNLWGTLILASISLLLAAVVGLTTVPYLARRVATARLRQAFDYDVTVVGIIYFVTVFLIGIAALNTGNNLLYIIVSALLAAVLVSGIASAMVLRNLELEVRVPKHVFAGRSTPGKIVVRNRSRWAPSFSIQVVSLKEDNSSRRWRWDPATFTFPPGRAPRKQWIRLPDRQLTRVAANPAPPHIFQGSAYFPYIPADCELAAELEFNFERRGRYRQESFGLATRFPFAFLTKTRRVPLQREIIVYPRVEPPEKLFAMLPQITGEFETFTRGRGSDLYRIREYMPEDSARHVDWKATAKSGSLKVREFSREDERKLRIVFDNPPPQAVSAPAYEQALGLAASLGWHFAAQNADISFVAGGCNRTNDIYEFLTYLALAEPQRLSSVIEDLEISDEYNVIFTTRPRSTIPPALWACSHFIFIGAQE